MEKIAENRALQQESETKKLQEEIHAKKVLEHNRKLQEINAAANANNQPTSGQQMQMTGGQAPAMQMQQ